MEEPHWARVDHPPIDYQDLHYFAAPKRRKGPSSLDEVDPELLRTYEKLGVPLKERAILAGVEAGENNVAVDAVFDSISFATTFRATLAKAGGSSARSARPCRTILIGTLVSGERGAPGRQLLRRPQQRCVLTDGSFVYVPKSGAARWNCRPTSVSMPANLATSSRRRSSPSRAAMSAIWKAAPPRRDENELHAAGVDWSRWTTPPQVHTVQNWYPGDSAGLGPSPTSSPSVPLGRGRAARPAGPR